MGTQRHGLQREHNSGCSSSSTGLLIQQQVYTHHHQAAHTRPIHTHKTTSPKPSRCSPANGLLLQLRVGGPGTAKGVAPHTHPPGSGRQSPGAEDRLWYRRSTTAAGRRGTKKLEHACTTRACAVARPKLQMRAQTQRPPQSATTAEGGAQFLSLPPALQQGTTLGHQTGA